MVSVVLVLFQILVSTRLRPVRLVRPLLSFTHGSLRLGEEKYKTVQLSWNSKPENLKLLNSDVSHFIEMGYITLAL